jgi:hypothetical protein
MTEQVHPDVPEEIFNEEDRKVGKEWVVHLHSITPLEISDVYAALEDEECKTELGALGVFPEDVTLNAVKFYHVGTFRGAYIKATKMCDKLNSMEEMGDSEWEFERGSIRPTDE